MFYEMASAALPWVIMGLGVAFVAAFCSRKK